MIARMLSGKHAQSTLAGESETSTAVRAGQSGRVPSTETSAYAELDAL